MKPQKADQAERPVRGLLALPSGEVPVGTRCVQLNIPDGDDYELLLMGVLDVLQHWNSYQRDPSHKAAEVATAWRNAFFGQTLFEVCMSFDLRIDPEDSCMLQKTTDGGATWQDVGSFRPCADAAAQDAIQDAIDDGTLGQRGQQGPGGYVPKQECRTYHVEMEGNERWLCPVPVSTGYSVKITNYTGGWSDGDLVEGLWFCPDGRKYFLGACGGEQPPEESDPLQSGHHMQLVARVGDDFGDPIADWWEIPDGKTLQPLYVQANDSVLTDNLGSVQFDIEICNYSQGWCYQWNLRDDNGGFYSQDGYGVWVDGEGWGPGGLNERTCDIQKDFGAVIAFDAARIYYDASGPGCGAGSAIIIGKMVDEEFQPFGEVGQLVEGTNNYWTNSGLATSSDNVVVYCNGASGQSVWFRLHDFILADVQGENPFGDDNCSY